MANKNNSKLTPELSAKFCEAISKGYSISGACGVTGISRQTYHNWYNRGETAKSGKYKQFKCDVDAAYDKATERAEKPIVDNIPRDSKEAKWWLIKRRQGLYGERTYNETKIDAEVKTDVTVNLLEKMKEKRAELNDLDKH
jgi:hypothetical protein